MIYDLSKALQRPEFLSNPDAFLDRIVGIFARLAWADVVPPEVPSGE